MARQFAMSLIGFLPRFLFELLDRQVFRYTTIAPKGQNEKAEPLTFFLIRCGVVRRSAT
jgi:hypothetical protein